jgi:hypothetical protein
MSETRAEQVAFGWAGDGSTGTKDGPSTSPPLRGGYARGERTSEGARRARGSTGAPRAEVAARLEALPPDNELWDVHAAARFLKRSVSWVYHRAEDGTLPVKRIGGWGLRFIRPTCAPGSRRAASRGEGRRGAARSSRWAASTSGAGPGG